MQSTKVNLTNPKLHEISDSEDDGDYVPFTGQESDSSDDEGLNTARAKVVEPTNEAKDSKDMKKVWENFEASLAQTPSSSQPVKLVKVLKRYRFAGEEHETILEVPEDSDDAKKWPLLEACSDIRSASKRLHESVPTTTSPSGPGDIDSPAEAVAPIPSPSSLPSQVPKRRPRPRKPTVTLTPSPGSSKTKKISTLEKSSLDWKAHLANQEDEAQEQLDANRRAGGYLEKVAFLNRVEERKEENLEAARSTKRRKL